MKDPLWISQGVVLALHDQQLQIHGGIPGIRDVSLLESALSRPLQLWQYGEPKPDLCSLAAAYAFGIAKNHGFLDGNKRTAHMVYRLFLAKNGIKLVASREDKYSNMIYLAAGQQSEESFAEWLRSVTRPVPGKCGASPAEPS